MKYQPKEIERQIEKINLRYENMLYTLANEIMENKLKPLLVKKQLAFTVMNGFPKVYDREGKQQTTPKEIVNIFESCRDIEGYTIGYKLPDFNPFNQDFGSLDIAAFNRQVGRLTENDAILSCMMSWK